MSLIVVVVVVVVVASSCAALGQNSSLRMGTRDQS